MTTYHTLHSEPSQHRSGAWFQNLQKVQKVFGGELFTSVARYDKSSRVAADCHTLSLLETNWIHSRDATLDKQVPAGRVLWNWRPGKRRITLGLRESDPDVT